MTPAAPRPDHGAALLWDSLATGTNDLTIRPLAGLDELDLFLQLPYVLNEEMHVTRRSSRIARPMLGATSRPEWP
jgi:hypothetical protein